MATLCQGKALHPLGRYATATWFHPGHPASTERSEITCGLYFRQLAMLADVFFFNTWFSGSPFFTLRQWEAKPIPEGVKIWLLKRFHHLPGLCGCNICPTSEGMHEHSRTTQLISNNLKKTGAVRNFTLITRLREPAIIYGKFPFGRQSKFDVRAQEQGSSFERAADPEILFRRVHPFGTSTGATLPCGIISFLSLQVWLIQTTHFLISPFSEFHQQIFLSMRTHSNKIALLHFLISKITLSPLSKQIITLSNYMLHKRQQADF